MWKNKNATNIYRQGVELYHKNCKKINHRLYVDAVKSLRPVLQYPMLMDFHKEGKPDFPIAALPI